MSGDLFFFHRFLQRTSIYIYWTDFSQITFSGMRTKYPFQVKFLLKLTSGWKDLIVSLLVQGLGGTHFFWLAYLMQSLDEMDIGQSSLWFGLLLVVYVFISCKYCMTIYYSGYMNA